MNNLKDKLSSYAAYILAVVGGIQTYLTIHAGQPINWGLLSLYVVGIIVGILTGKNPDGSTKSLEQVVTQNTQAKQ